MSFGLPSNPQQPPPITSGPPTSLLGSPPQGLMSSPAVATAALPMQPTTLVLNPLSTLNPALNDAPLEFNKNKGKPPMAVMNVEEDNENDSDEPSIIAEEITIRSKNDKDSREKETQKERDDRLRERDRMRDRDRDRDRDRGRDRDRERDRERDRDRDRERRDRDRDRNGRDRRERKTDERMEGSNGLLPKPDMLPGALPGPGPNGGPIPVGPAAGLVAPPSAAGPGGAGGPGGPGAPGPPAIVPNNMWGGMMNPMMSMMGNMMGPMMGMAMDPAMMGMGQFGMMGGVMPDGTVMGPDGSIMPPDPSLLMAPHPPEDAGVTKEIVHCKECTLFPPNPNAPIQSTRERPLGCRTIFVGGLPDNATEDMIREIFQRCGEIQTIRMSKKNFCHVRFMFETSVEAAFYFSGYRMRIGSNTDSPNTGRLHVDYAQARDDFHEWECAQRQLQREARHRQRMEQELLHPPSPPPIAHYSEHEAVVVADKIKGDESFGQAVQTLITWLERGNCSKRNANQFYSMIQAANSHVRRLLNEKAQLEEELQAAKDVYKGRMQGLIIQFGDIERVFTSASHKKVWDHFTKAQRKNIDLWKKQSMEIKSVQLEDAVLHNEEMDVSDEEDSNQKKKRREDSPATVSMSDSDTLKEENDSLRCQLEAYKNEVDLVRADLKAELSMKEQQLKVVQQTMQGLQQKLLEGRRKQLEDEVKIKDLTARLAESAKSNKGDVSVDGEKSNEACELGDESRNQTSDSCDLGDSRADSEVGSKIKDREAKLIGIISTFLHVHPFGAGVDYVWSYLQKMEPSLRPSEVEALLTRFPTVFRQELCGIGANMERRWQFCGFSSLDHLLI